MSLVYSLNWAFNLVWCPFHWLRNSRPWWKQSSFPISAFRHASSWLFHLACIWREVGYLTSINQRHSPYLPLWPWAAALAIPKAQPSAGGKMGYDIQCLIPSQTSFVASFWLWSQLLLMSVPNSPTSLVLPWALQHPFSVHSAMKISQLVGAHCPTLQTGSSPCGLQSVTQPLTSRR